MEGGPRQGRRAARTRAALSNICSRRHLTAIGPLIAQARTYHFALHSVIERDPSFLHLWSKCSTKLLFQAAYQRVAKRSEMKWLRPELSMLAARMANDRLDIRACRAHQQWQRSCPSV